MNPRASPRRWPFIAAFIIFIVLVESSYLIWSHFREAHDHGDHGAPGLTLNGGQRWATDEPLRLGMQRIRDAVALQNDASNLSPVRAMALANTVRENVKYLFENCHLAPEADATLHVIINDLMAGASLLTTEGQSGEGLARLRHALGEYPRYFNHPNWNPLPNPRS